MYVHPPYCDYGEIVPYSCTAVVFNPEHGAKILMPQKNTLCGPSKGEMALCAFFQKLTDEEWLDKLIEEVYPNTIE